MNEKNTIQSVVKEPGFSARGNMASEKRTKSAKPRVSEHLLKVKKAMGSGAYIKEKRVNGETQFFDENGEFGRNMPVAILARNGGLIFLTGPVKAKNGGPAYVSATAKAKTRKLRVPRFLKECLMSLKGVKNSLFEFPAVIQEFMKQPEIKVRDGKKLVTYRPVMAMGGERTTHVLILHNNKMLPVKMDGEMIPPRMSRVSKVAKMQFTAWIKDRAGSLGLVRHVLRKNLISEELLPAKVGRSDEVTFATSEDQLYATVKTARGFIKTNGPSPYDGLSVVPAVEKPSTNTLLNQTIKCDGTDVSQVFDLVKAGAQFSSIGRLGRIVHEEAFQQRFQYDDEETQARHEVIRRAFERRVKRPSKNVEDAPGKTSQRQNRQATQLKQRKMYAGQKSKSRGMRTNKSGKGRLNRSKNQGVNRKKGNSFVPKSAHK